MSILGDVAVEAELERLLSFIKDNAGRPAQSVLVELKKKIEEDLAAARSGWL